MKRCGAVFALGLLTLLAACEQKEQLLRVNLGAVAPASAPAPAVMVAQQGLVTGSLVQAGPKLAYTHNLSIEMADDKVAPRFERARTACLQDQSLNCNLLQAAITVGDVNAGVRPSARLSVRLPHDSVARFQTALLQPLQGEEPGQPTLRQSTTNAEDLTNQLLDLDRWLAQANDYRDRLTVLSRRGDAKFEDLIKVNQTLSEVQSSIEQMTSESRRLNVRVDTELLNVSLDAYSPVLSVASPLGTAWRDGARALGESAASAFLFVVVLLPWIPLAILAPFLLVVLWRFIQRVRRVAWPNRRPTNPQTP